MATVRKWLAAEKLMNSPMNHGSHPILAWGRPKLDEAGTVATHEEGAPAYTPHWTSQIPRPATVTTWLAWGMAAVACLTGGYCHQIK